MNDFATGSIWRKWDLHIHTPASFHWNDGARFIEMQPAEKDETLRKIIEKINESEVAAFAVMDYWTFDGYLAIKEASKSGPVKLNKPVFPGIELRIEAPVDYKLNIQVILSDNLSKQQLTDFKSRLLINGKPLSADCLTDVGKSMDASKALKHGFSKSDLTDATKLWELGSKTSKISRESLFSALSILPTDSALIVMPYDTSDGLDKLKWEEHPHDDNYFMQSAHMFETRTESNVDLFLHRETELNKKFIENFKKTMGGRPKPVMSGSDAHKVSDYGTFPGTRITWFKADPTFKGLLQVCNEPLDRCFIGDNPPKLRLVQGDKTKFIKSLVIDRKPGATLLETWFESIELPFNPDLVAIIGNKGKGKSALTDIIGLLGNTSKHEEFTFLSTRSFRQAKDNKAKHFTAALHMEGGHKVLKPLEGDIDESAPELIKYIPQNFLEKICSQIGQVDESDFDRELKEVIFSHVSQSERLGLGCLDDLIDYKTTEALDTIDQQRDELSKINAQICEFELGLYPETKSGIESALKLKKQELLAHDETKPKEITKPGDSQSDPKLAEVTQQLEEMQRKVAELDETIGGATKAFSEETRLIALCDKLIVRLENISRQFDKFKHDSESDFKEVGLSLEDIIKVEVNREILTQNRSNHENKKQLAGNVLDQDVKGAAAFDRKTLATKIAELQAKLDEPSRAYQAHLASMKVWSIRRKEIVGDRQTTGTIENLKAQLESIEKIPDKLKKLKEDRIEKAMKIHEEIRKLAKVYRRLYAPVHEFIESKSLKKDQYELNFEVSVNDVGFEEKFFELVSKNSAGSFYGSEDGHKRLVGILSNCDFNQEKDAKLFLETILDNLSIDKRRSPGAPNRVEGQLRKGKSVNALYDLIFSFQYLAPKYSMKMGSKNLQELSPGERGALLLIFYLLVDKGTVPLVIDQPEENLDNQTLYELLVPCIKQAKSRRQIIIVTHNPNLAVVCDAEQVIVAKLDKKNNYKMQYLSGSIENPIINSEIVDILEGTMPAFNNRGDKYFPQ